MKSNTKFDKTEYKLIMPEAPIRDGNLSLKARGLLAYINTNRIFDKDHPWNLYESQVIKSCHADGRTSVQSAFKELEEKGYLEKHSRKDKNGHFMKGSLWIVHNHPVSRKAGIQVFRNPEILSNGNSATNYYQNQLLSNTTTINHNQSSSSVPSEDRDQKDEDDSRAGKRKRNQNRLNRRLYKKNGYSNTQINRAILQARAHHAKDQVAYAESILAREPSRREISAERLAGLLLNITPVGKQYVRERQSLDYKGPVLKSIEQLLARGYSEVYLQKIILIGLGGLQGSSDVISLLNQAIRLKDSGISLSGISNGLVDVTERRLNL